MCEWGWSWGKRIIFKLFRRKQNRKRKKKKTKNAAKLPARGFAILIADFKLGLYSALRIAWAKYALNSGNKQNPLELSILFFFPKYSTGEKKSQNKKCGETAGPRMVRWPLSPEREAGAGPAELPRARSGAHPRGRGRSGRRGCARRTWAGEGGAAAESPARPRSPRPFPARPAAAPTRGGPRGAAQSPPRARSRFPARRNGVS